ncbi:MAG: bifunctional phosphoglucose/phosphomannose isomerase [Sphaerimonospora mesophila]
MEILDDIKLIAERDPQGALTVIADSAAQLAWDAVLEQPDSGQLNPLKIVLAGMGGSAQPGKLAANWLDLEIPFAVVSNYKLPRWVDENTLVIASSFSGNTEETIASLEFAEERGATVVVMASGGKLIDIAQERGLPFIRLMKVPQPRYSAIAQLKAIARFLEHYGVAKGIYGEVNDVCQIVSEVVSHSIPTVETVDNPAKQLALKCVGKTPIIYASSLFAPVAFKWKISFNENAKNTAWWNELPEFSHNEFIGWSSHPVEKPFAIIDLHSSFDSPRIKQRFALTEQLLSGQRPAASEVQLKGDSILAQMIYGFILADFVSIYLGILNGVNPTPVALVEEFKKQLG